MILLSPLDLSKSNNIRNRKQIILIAQTQLIVALIHQGQSSSVHFAVLLFQLC